MDKAMVDGVVDAMLGASAPPLTSWLNGQKARVAYFVTVALATHRADEQNKGWVQRAIKRGADAKAIRTLVHAGAIFPRATATVPFHRFEELSRGKGWIRKGTGDAVEWGQRSDKGWVVGPGKWVHYASDGYNREKRVDHTVKHVQVGDATWTILL